MNYEKSALLVIDMQYDFMLDGSLEVKEANDLIQPINDLMKLNWNLVVASKDWHPENHISFASNHEGCKPYDEIILEDGTKQILWPDHCIQNSSGAEIHAEMDQSCIDEIVLKGQNPNVDSYSAFFDNNHLEKTEMDTILKANGIENIYVVGLARDFCVKWTAMDGQELGYNSYFVIDATKAVDPSTDDEVIKELKESNVTIIKISDIQY
ncbi:bifunctional nicotinamidase/pyrazinamidase [Kordia jejudonensis]|uniref:bifunctional nicotinamidase/pyrazinamidase n=1 Tax=Kordia jejudonensis TaxID=1348245 RepID=UPI0006292D1A|nr:bifunctional nicotinamidase/pyrazinamidase [Kordia jejudonensis]